MKKILIAILGGTAAMMGIGLLSIGQSMNSGWQLLMAPFGATAVLLFAAPLSPFSKPLNVIGGHLITATIGLLFAEYIDFGAWTVAAATGLAITAMVITNTLHPPAGANPILIIQSQQGWIFLLEPVLLGAIGLVISAKVFEKTKDYFNKHTQAKMAKPEDTQAQKG